MSLLWGCAPTPAPLPASDVLLVILDTVRADRLHTYGHQRTTSQQLDELARAGVLFEDATSASSWTFPAHASLFSQGDDVLIFPHGAASDVAPSSSTWRQIRAGATTWR